MKVKRPIKKTALAIGDKSLDCDTTHAVTVRSELHCSFCGKNEKDTAKLIAGPNIYICDECVSLCVQIIADEQNDKSIVFPEVVKLSLQYLDTIDETLHKIREDLKSKVLPPLRERNPYLMKSAIQTALAEVIKLVNSLPAGNSRTLALCRLKEAVLWAEAATEDMPKNDR